MQPMAGPWLSPNVVTVNSLPIVLPDMFIGKSHLTVLLRTSASFPAAKGVTFTACAQLFRREQEDTAAATLEFQPRERQMPVGASDGRCGVAYLDDQNSARTQVAARVP